MTDRQYVCGHSVREFRRLELQGDFYAEITRFFLERAGIRSGMSMIDLGCGVGDVTLLAAERVGARGRVTGIDHSAEAIDWATARAAALGCTNVRFRVAAIEALELDSPVDAAVGRFVLMHQADPVHTVQFASRHVKPGGLVVFLESHLDASVAGLHSSPHSATYDQALRLMSDCIRAAGAHTDIGLRLGQIFQAAGLPAPRLWLQARVEGGPDAMMYRYVAESLESMRSRSDPTVSSALDLANLEMQLREEVVQSGGVLTSPLVVGAWSRLPDTGS